ncbi:YolD-like family protein [Paenibacillus sp. N1-5-1-14]|uniref:YolD-like family protein n=1 Tax=Paenibacillus radicibacter TaxID=2972488 RepID=UPI002159A2B6|nr:YolD-like family protein [Paenibacillus radicibacter]MCR8641417.1 YolD-like family protein [Paenibacillus radicibacter]
MSKKLHGNGMWEASRMMISEHKEAILKRNEEPNRVLKPTLVDDEITYIADFITGAYCEKERVAIDIYGTWGKREILGIVSSIDQYGKKIKVEFDNGFEWVDFDEILSVRSN